MNRTYNSLQEKRKFEFSDFYITKLGYQGAKQETELTKGDYVIDENGTPGRVKLTSVEHGNLIQFIDGLEVFDDNLKLRKMFTNGKTIYDYQKKYFNLITALARIVEENVADAFPYTHMFNNSDNIWVRGSTLQGIVDKFSHQNFNEAHSLFSTKFTPPYTFEIEIFELKKQLRKTRFVYTFLKHLFIDIDIKMVQKNRIKYIVKDNNDYNKIHWKKILKQFKKLNIKFLGEL